MCQTFFKIEFEDKNEIDYGMFREINEIVAKIRFEGYGKILSPRYDYYDNSNIVNNLGNKIYLCLYVLHGDEQDLRKIIRNQIKNLGYNYSYEIKMPNFIEIFYNTSQLDNPTKFENELKTKIKENNGIINRCSEFKNNYESSITFKLECQMHDFDKKLNGIIEFLKMNLDGKYFIEYS